MPPAGEDVVHVVEVRGSLTWLLGLVRFEAAHIPGLLRHEDVCQSQQTALKLASNLQRNRPGISVSSSRLLLQFSVVSRGQ